MIKGWNRGVYLNSYAISAPTSRFTMWYDFKFRPSVFNRDQVEKDAEYIIKLLPE
jgi:hypothetical protein